MKRYTAALIVVAFAALLIHGCQDDSVVNPRPGIRGFQMQAVGDLIQNVNLPVGGTGVSVAVDCNGVVYYTNQNDINLYAMDKDGNLLSTTPILDSATGQGLFIDEFAWDQSRMVLWGQLHGSNPIDVYHIDTTTGIATFQWTSATNSIGTFRDGIAYDGTDDTIWITGDVSSTVEHYQANGTFINQITPKDAGGAVLDLISGITVGIGDLLYLGQNGRVMIVQVKKSNGDFIASFASPGGARDEGLECDPVNFAPKLALWSREFNSPGFISAIEIEDGTCVCGGGVTEIEVPVDIKPTSCPNPINPKSNGRIPVAVLGTADFDVSEIDPTTILLEGVAPLRWNLDDVATPYEPFLGKEMCMDCNTLGPDGFMDLTLKFRTQDIIAALGEVQNCMVLTLTGNLLDGTPIIGEDVMRGPQMRLERLK